LAPEAESEGSVLSRQGLERRIGAAEVFRKESGAGQRKRSEANKTGEGAFTAAKAMWFTMIKSRHLADVAELADALDSGSSVGNYVEVQVLSSAPLTE
jgi:hypothetical protein